MEARVAYKEALRKLIEQLDNCKTIERGIGGQTIDAMVDRTFLLNVKLRWVEDARDVLYGNE